MRGVVIIPAYLPDEKLESVVDEVYELGYHIIVVDESKVTDRTKIMILVSPGNSTGSILSKKCLEQIAAFAKKHELIIVSDEIYERTWSKYARNDDKRKCGSCMGTLQCEGRDSCRDRNAGGRTENNEK